MEGYPTLTGLELGRGGAWKFWAFQEVLQNLRGHVATPTLNPKTRLNTDIVARDHGKRPALQSQPMLW